VTAPHAYTQNSQPMIAPNGTIVDSYMDFGPKRWRRARRRPRPAPEAPGPLRRCPARAQRRTVPRLGHCPLHRWWSVVGPPA
jgi:hypothetical protein